MEIVIVEKSMRPLNERYGMERYSLGIDIGGTFTDIVLYDYANKQYFSRKVLTTHGNPAQAVIDGIHEIMCEHSIDGPSIERVVHATTLFTNALIERKGAVTGLITTEGFRDTLEIGRERKYELYDLQIDNPPPLVPRELRVEVKERMKANGEVSLPLDQDSVRHAIQELISKGVESVAIVFLHSYFDATNEILSAEFIAKEFPQLMLTTSHEVVREIREFERASTTVANAYVKPLAHRYLDEMRVRLTSRQIPAALLLMLSNGGLTHVDEAKKNPVQMLESGPAAGALAAAYFGKDDSNGALLAFDMGGTTAKLCVVDGGEPLVAYGFEAARQKRFIEGSGLPLRISTVELIEIGAGGGSIARTDGIGLLKVGPDSAGSEPGPACYGLGGGEPTVTDADLVLGYLNPDFFAGGSMKVYLDRAQNAINQLAEKLALSPIKVAWGIHDVVNENMAGAARVQIAERGRDPRNYAILSTGGAGPVHVYYVARKIGVKKIICPPSAGVASALGLLVAPAKVDRVATVAVGMRLDTVNCTALEAAFKRLEHEAESVITDTQVSLQHAKIERFADGRFVGQGFNLVVALPSGPYDKANPSQVRAELQKAFELASREKFSRTPPNVPIEFISLRVTMRVPVNGDDIKISREAFVDGLALKGYRKAYFPESDGFLETPVYSCSRMKVGEELVGPAIFEDEGSTFVVGPEAMIKVAPSRNIIVTLQ